jgi:serine/threonine protein kinase
LIRHQSEGHLARHAIAHSDRAIAVRLAHIAQPVAGEWSRELTLADWPAEALQSIHAARLVYRDLKPSNILPASGQGKLSIGRLPPLPKV